MHAPPNDRDIDRLIHRLRRIDAQVRHGFALPAITGRALEPAERRLAQALIVDLTYVLGELRRQHDLTRRCLTTARESASASLTYLNVGRMARSPRRAIRA